MSLYGFWIFLAAVFTFVGACVGSFLNVVAWRLPAGQSVASPPSACPKCGSRIRPWDNIPVLSWLILHGKCRDCGTKISPRYPMVEALCGGLWLVVFLHTIPKPEMLLKLGMLQVPALFGLYVSALLAMSLIDADHFIIPDVISLPLIPIGIAVTALLNLQGLPSISVPASIFGATAGAGIMLAIALLGRLLFGREAMGMGDVKLVAMIGAWQGLLPALPLTVFLGSLLGSIFGISATILRGGKPPKLPFGPYLCAGAVGAWLFGDPIVAWLLPEL